MTNPFISSYISENENSPKSGLYQSQFLNNFKKTDLLLASLVCLQKLMKTCGLIQDLPSIMNPKSFNPVELICINFTFIQTLIILFFHEFKSLLRIIVIRFSCILIKKIKKKIHELIIKNTRKIENATLYCQKYLNTSSLY